MHIHNCDRQRHRGIIWYFLGGCQITFYLAGHNDDPEYSFQIIPDDIRGMAGSIINKCVGSGLNYASGGYITLDISNAVDYITTPTTNLSQLYPESASFYTLSISTLRNWDDLDYPGDYHPYTGSVLSTTLMLKWLSAVEGTATYEFLRVAALRFYKNAVEMRRGLRRGWYDVWEQT